MKFSCLHDNASGAKRRRFEEQAIQLTGKI